VHRILGGEKKNLSCLQEHSAFCLKTERFFLSLLPLSQRYQKAAEEATAEKKRSVSICFLGNKQQAAIRMDHLYAVFL